MSDFNAKEVKEQIVQWIKDWFAENGPEASAVIGISGGKDSSVVAALCVEALGKDRVFGVLMPNGEQSDIDDAKKLVKFLEIPNVTVNIESIYNEFYETFKQIWFTVGDEYGTSMNINNAIINTPPRVRMTTLYNVAAILPNGGRVANTCNYSEDYVGYATKYGDGAGDFSPISDLTVQEVIAIGEELGLPEDLVHKTPSDGLCGKTDEDNLGFTYKVLDEYITTGKCEDEAIKEIIDRKHVQNLHKLQTIPKFEFR